METVRAEVETVKADITREMVTLHSLKADVGKELDVIRAQMEELRAKMASAPLSSAMDPGEIMDVDLSTTKVRVLTIQTSHIHRTELGDFVLQNTRATLKRKRDAAEENDEVPSLTEAAVQADVSSASCGTSTENSVTTNPSVEVLRPHKRRRSNIAMRIVGGVAKTTAIAAVGAVAAWSALAFS